MDLALLQEAVTRGTLSLDVSDVFDKMKKEKVNEIHMYTITAPADGKKGRWQTYIKDEDGNRIKVSSTTEKGLYEKLYEHYFGKNVRSLKDIYPEWLDRRNEQGISPRTVHRNMNHWGKYYKYNKIVEIPLVRLTTDQIESFFHECIKKYDLTVKELSNMRFIMSDMLKMARKKHYIELNPYNDVDVNLNGCRPITKKKDTSRVYLTDEKEILFSELNREMIQNPDSTDYYAVFILFKLGLRIGELVALKWDDLDEKNREIHIHRMESKDLNEEDDLRPVVVDYTKKKSPYGDRFLPLSEYELNIFHEIKRISSENRFKEQEYIFCDRNGRTKIREIDHLIRKACNKANIDVKSAHDIRRTVASEMFAQGVPVEIIRGYLGHSDIKTTFGYILNNQTKEKTNRIILNSLNQMNGLKRTQNH